VSEETCRLSRLLTLSVAWWMDVPKSTVGRPRPAHIPPAGTNRPGTVNATSLRKAICVNYLIKYCRRKGLPQADHMGTKTWGCCSSSTIIYILCWTREKCLVLTLFSEPKTPNQRLALVLFGRIPDSMISKLPTTPGHPCSHVPRQGFPCPFVDFPGPDPRSGYTPNARHRCLQSS
jgi:hypothetical protein